MVRWPSLTFQKHMAYHIWKFIASNPVLCCIIQSLSCCQHICTWKQYLWTVTWFTPLWCLWSQIWQLLSVIHSTLTERIKSLVYHSQSSVSDSTLNKLQQKAASPLLELAWYIETTWLNSTVWSMRSWSVFGCHTRTNNDVEGWHHRLNKKARKGQLPFYVLIPLLHEEAKQVSIQVHLISESKLTHQECLKYHNNQSSVFKHWEDYINRNKTPSQLLNTCSNLVPVPN